MRPVLVLYFILSGCSSSKLNKSDDLYKELPLYLSNYYQTDDSAFLINAYELLKENQDFKQEGLTDDNYRTVLPIFFHLKKYNELLNLLEEENSIQSYEKQIILNLVKYLCAPPEKKDSSIIMIQQNIQIINNQLKKNPMDSMKLIDYFTNKLYVIGLDSTMKMIDSMKTHSSQFSNSFYENTLKEGVLSYHKYFME